MYIYIYISLDVYIYIYIYIYISIDRPLQHWPICNGQLVHFMSASGWVMPRGYCPYNVIYIYIYIYIDR